MAKRYPGAKRGAKILTAMQFKAMWKQDPKKKHKSFMGGDAAGYDYYVRRNLSSRAFGKRGLQELADTERKIRRKK